MFWDILISGIDAQDQPLRHATFEALSEQLQSDNEWVQASALHGFSHLRDQRCRKVINVFLKTCSDPSLADYARRAMKFELL
jgi:hypothetical protein